MQLIQYRSHQVGTAEMDVQMGIQVNEELQDIHEDKVSS